MRLIMLGAPGSGKGTQAQRLTERFNIPQISTGDIFRKNMKEGTPLGIKVKKIIDAGELVPDDVVIEIVADRLQQDDCKNGYILDGFPRSIPQAEALEKVADIDAVIELSIPDQVIINRMTGRRTCKDCGTVYHIDNIGQSKVCGKCNGELIIRSDDQHETVVNRLKVYENTTKPLSDFYRKKGKLHIIDADRNIDLVTEAIIEALK